MLGFIVKKILGSKNDREVKKLAPLVEEINGIEEKLCRQNDNYLRERTKQWQAELSQIEDDEALAKRLEEILPEAFAVVKNACRRLTESKAQIDVRGHKLPWEMIPFDVQLIGGHALHSGKIAEMATGEGKTLVATCPVYLNALTGRGVHVVTVNDYLAQRDAEWMGAVYKFLGLTVGVIIHDQPPNVRREQYECDITYGTNSEFGFDYLRDNGMAARAEDQVQRHHYFAIVDEVDSILIDEARTPLIISGPAVVNTDNTLYNQLKPRIENLVRQQEKLTTNYLNEAETFIRKYKPEDGSQPENPQDLAYEIGLLLYKVKLGSPRSERLLRIFENPEFKTLAQKAELELHADQTKKALYEQKEELFFSIEEKSNEADLTEKGRGFLSPGETDAFLLPDLTVALHEIDSSDESDPKKRMEAKEKVQKDFEDKSLKIHTISQLLRAYCIYKKDVQYVVQDNKVVIVDENTGRLMTGRRWSDGLHQAVEAKEGVTIEKETQTYATITIQNYFRLYTKLAGMTGTAETEANEFLDIYKLGVLVIPTNRVVARNDRNDTVYKTRREKFEAVLKEVQEVHKEGRPILLGTVSVESSEFISKMLKRAGIVHSVLNAKYHQQEAEIVTRAGQRGSVTIATNMAGRGTDIKLGAGVAELGGLHVIGTERHESRRIDRQLRGRCARQGDPGSSHFFISLEDDLMRLFGSDKITRVMETMGFEDGQELEHPFLNKSIQNAQKKVEQHNFQMRKRTLEYDDVMNKQRQVIYDFRNEIIRGDDVHDQLMDIMEEVILQKVEEFSDAEEEPETWNIRGLSDWANLNFPLGMPEEELLKAAKEGKVDPVEGSLFDGLSAAQFGVVNFLADSIKRAYQLKQSFEDPEAMKGLERFTILTAIDKKWQEHLYNMDGLRTSIGLRAYGQRDPLLEYKAEAFKVFGELMVNIKTEICHNTFRSASSLMAFEQFLQNLPRKTTHQDVSAFDPSAGPSPGSRTREVQGSTVVSEVSEALEKSKPVVRAPKVGRNDPCPCGSGKKYKQCCGKL